MLRWYCDLHHFPQTQSFPELFSPDLHLPLDTLVNLAAGVATLHTGLELGFNLHSLTYGLLLAVVASGLYGVLVFSRVPAHKTNELGDDSIQTLVSQIQEIDRHARKLTLRLPDEFNTLVLDAAKKTQLRGTVFDHLSRATSRGCPSTRAVARMQLLNRHLKDEQGRRGREVFDLMPSRRTAVERIRGEFRSQARLRLWLMLHVPMWLALLCALAGHIVSVFIYW